MNSGYNCRLCKKQLKTDTLPKLCNNCRKELEKNIKKDSKESLNIWLRFKVNLKQFVTKARLWNLITEKTTIEDFLDLKHDIGVYFDNNAEQITQDYIHIGDTSQCFRDFVLESVMEKLHENKIKMGVN